jgi:hypothetical protein
MAVNFVYSSASLAQPPTLIARVNAPGLCCSCEKYDDKSAGQISGGLTFRSSNISCRMDAKGPATILNAHSQKVTESKNARLVAQWT